MWFNIMQSGVVPLAARTVVFGHMLPTGPIVTFSFIFPPKTRTVTYTEAYDNEDFYDEHCRGCDRNPRNVRDAARELAKIEVNEEHYVDLAEFDEACLNRCIDLYCQHFDNRLEEGEEPPTPDTITNDQVEEAKSMYMDCSEVQSIERLDYVDADAYDEAVEAFQDNYEYDNACPDACWSTLEDGECIHELSDIVSPESATIYTAPYAFSEIVNDGKVFYSIYPFIVLDKKGRGYAEKAFEGILDYTLDMTKLAYCVNLEQQEAWAPECMDIPRVPSDLVLSSEPRDKGSLEEYIERVQSCDVKDLIVGRFSRVPNIFGDSQICMGDGHISSLLDAVYHFWSSGFNSDLANSADFFHQVSVDYGTGPAAWYNYHGYVEPPDAISDCTPQMVYAASCLRTFDSYDEIRKVSKGIRSTSEPVLGWVYYQVDVDDESMEMVPGFAWVKADEDMQPYFEHEGVRVPVAMEEGYLPGSFSSTKRVRWEVQ